MKVGKHWLELDDEDGIHVALHNSSGPIGGRPTRIDRVVLEAIADSLPNVIIKNGPLRFYKTEEDMRISFTEDEHQKGLSGYDRISTKEFVEAARKILDANPARKPKLAAKRKPAPSAKRSKPARKKAAAKQ